MNSVERRAAHVALGDIGFKSFGLVDQGRGHGEAGADGGVDLVRDARHQPSQRGQFLGLHQTALRGAQIVKRLRQLPAAFLQLGEQPRVLDGDDRLPGKGLQELDLRLRKQLRLQPHHRDRADRDLVAQHRHDQDAAIARCLLQFAVAAGDQHIRLMHDAPLADRHRDQILAGERRRIGLAHRRHRCRRKLIMRDQMDVIPVPAIDGAQHALAEPRCVPDDPVEHRRKIGRRVGDQAQDLGCRGLALSALAGVRGQVVRLRFALDFRLPFSLTWKRARPLAQCSAFAASPYGFAAFSIRRLLQNVVSLPAPGLRISHRIGLG